VTSGTLITLAPTGAESAKADVPALPVTVDEVVATARDCQAIGAAVIHLHVRGEDTRPTLDLGRCREVVQAVREATDLVVQISTGGAVTDPFDARLAVLDVEPDAASLTLGTVNFGRDVFSNPWDLIVELHTQMQQRGIVPEYEVFDLGQLQRCSGCWTSTARRTAVACTSTWSWGSPVACPGRRRRSPPACRCCRRAPPSPPPAWAELRCR